VEGCPARAIPGQAPLRVLVHRDDRA
jgi:hypothetical protein